MGTDGNYYACSYNVSSIVRISTANALTTISCNIGVGMMIVNPNNPAQGIAWDAIGGGCITFNGAINSGSPTGTHNGGGAGVSIVATDCPWLELTGNPSLGPIDWDPFLTTSATSLAIGTGSKTLTVATNQNIAVMTRSASAIPGRSRITCAAWSRPILPRRARSRSRWQRRSLAISRRADGRQRNLSRLGADQGPHVVRLRRRAALYGRAVVQRVSDLQQSNIRHRNAIVLRRAVASRLDPLLIASDFPFRTQTVNPVGQTVGNSLYVPVQGITDGNFACYAASDPSTTFYVTLGRFTRAPIRG